MQPYFICGLILIASVARAEGPSPLAASLLFHASFDESADADFAKGDGKIYTARSLKRETVRAGLHSDAVTIRHKGGRYGGLLSFSKKSDQMVFYQGAGNLPTRAICDENSISPGAKSGWRSYWVSTTSGR